MVQGSIEGLVVGISRDSAGGRSYKGGDGVWRCIDPEVPSGESTLGQSPEFLRWSAWLREVKNRDCPTSLSGSLKTMLWFCPPAPGCATLQLSEEPALEQGHALT